MLIALHSSRADFCDRPPIRPNREGLRCRDPRSCRSTRRSL